MDDAALVARVGQGDGEALEALYERYGRPCFGLARRILTDDQFAQDCVQEVFLTLWRDSSRYDPRRGGFSTWLLSMTHHKAVDIVRREESLRRRRTGVDVLEGVASDLPAPEDAAQAAYRDERVRAALSDLPDLQREALALAYYGGYTQREIAGLTGTPLGTVKTRTLAGMRRMRDSLTAFTPSGDPDDPAPVRSRAPAAADQTRRDSGDAT